MKKQTGFTLIEILVVISISALLVTLGISSYNEFNRRQVLDQATKNIVNDLRFIQSKASAGDKGPVMTPPASPTCTVPLDGWYFEIITANQYKFYGQCGAVIFDSKSTNLPSNLTFIATASVSVPGAKILFKPLNLGIDNDYTITLQFSSVIAMKKSIGLTKSGTINLSN